MQQLPCINKKASANIKNKSPVPTLNNIIGCDWRILFHCYFRLSRFSGAVFKLCLNLGKCFCSVALRIRVNPSFSPRENSSRGILLLFHCLLIITPSLHITGCGIPAAFEWAKEKPAGALLFWFLYQHFGFKDIYLILLTGFTRRISSQT